jgi:hypothetical protein
MAPYRGVHCCTAHVSAIRNDETYVRLTPREYRTVCTLCRSTNFQEYPTHALRLLLVGSLADTWPELATKLCQLSDSQLTVLYDHMLQTAQPEGATLTAEEVELVTATAGPLLTKARFLRPLQAALVKLLRGNHPTLAGKLACLSTAEFQAACERRKV